LKVDATIEIKTEVLRHAKHEGMNMSLFCENKIMDIHGVSASRRESVNQNEEQMLQ
jgi:hypothetical protein